MTVAQMLRQIALDAQALREGVETDLREDGIIQLHAVRHDGEARGAQMQRVLDRILHSAENANELLEGVVRENRRLGSPNSLDFP